MKRQHSRRFIRDFSSCEQETDAVGTRFMCLVKPILCSGSASGRPTGLERDERGERHHGADDEIVDDADDKSSDQIQSRQSDDGHRQPQRSCHPMLFPRAVRQPVSRLTPGRDRAWPTGTGSARRREKRRSAATAVSSRRGPRFVYGRLCARDAIEITNHSQNLAVDRHDIPVPLRCRKRWSDPAVDGVGRRGGAGWRGNRAGRGQGVPRGRSAARADASNAAAGRCVSGCSISAAGSFVSATTSRPDPGEGRTSSYPRLDHNSRSGHELRNPEIGAPNR